MKNKLSSDNKTVSDKINKLEKDRVYVNSLNKKTFKFYKTNIKQATKYNIEAKIIAKKLDYNIGLADSQLNSGLINIFVSNYEEALIMLNSAIKIYKSLKRLDKVTDCLLAISDLHKYKGDLNESLIFFKKALVLSTRRYLPIRKGHSLLNIGIIQSNSGAFEESISNLKKALKIFLITEDKSGISTVYNNLGIIHSCRYENYLALEYYYKSLNIEKKLQNQNGIARSLFNIGHIYSIQEDLYKALDYCNDSYIIFKELKNTRNSVTVLSQIASIQYNQKKHKTAISSYKKCLKEAKEINFKVEIGNILTGLSLVLTDLEEYQLALKYSKEALEVYTKMSDKEGVCYAHMGIGQNLFGMKENDLAISNLLKSKAIAKKT